MTEQRTNERRIEQQLDEFRTKWKKEIQQRTVYGHVIDDEQQQEEKIADNEEQVEKKKIEPENFVIHLIVF
jgi:hypothetical protein